MGIPQRFRPDQEAVDWEDKKDEGRAMVIMREQEKVVSGVEGGRAVIGEGVREATGGGENLVEGAVAQQVRVPKSLHKSTDAGTSKWCDASHRCLQCLYRSSVIRWPSLAGFAGERSCRG